MKVVLKTTILDRIRKDIEAAHNRNRVPEYIVVTREEYRELLEIPYIHNALMRDHLRPLATREEFEGARDATFKTYDFPRTAPGCGGPPFLRTFSQESLLGYPLLVVPKAYHPL